MRSALVTLNAPNAELLIDFRDLHLLSNSKAMAFRFRDFGSNHLAAQDLAFRSVDR